MEKAPLRLPKLKTRDDLLRTAPELGRLLAGGEAEARAGPAPRARGPSPLKARPRSSAMRRAISPGRLSRKFTDDVLTEEDRVRGELERAKAERTRLLQSLARLRADAGKSGGKLQQEDVRLLRRELESKQEKLNELRRGTQALGDELEALETTSRDCEQLMPQAMAGLRARAAALEAELGGVERGTLEAEARHELYKLLELRTWRDHAAAQQRMRETRALREGAVDDLAVLTRQVHEMRAAKEDAERELAAAVAAFDQVRGNWGRKLQDRRKEVRELERRNSEDERRRAALAALAAEKARLEQDRVERARKEREAATRRLSVVVPELELLELSWSRLRGVCGAATADDLIAHWRDLQAKQGSMRELVRLAEAREARVKQQVADLQADGTGAAQAEAEAEQQQPAAAAAGGAPAEPAADADADEQEEVGGAAERGASAEEAGGEAGGSEDVPAAMDAASPAPEGGKDATALQATEGGGSAEAQADSSLAAAINEQAEQTPAPADEASALAEEAPALAADQSALAADQSAPGDEAPATAEEAPAGEALAASLASVPAAPAPAATQDVGQLLQERQAQIAEALRRKQTAKQQLARLHQVCVAADQGLHLLSSRLGAAMDPGDGLAPRRASALHDGGRTTASDRRRSSLGGRHGGGPSQRANGHHAVRLSAAGLAERRASLSTLLPAPVGGPKPSPPGRGQPRGEFHPGLPPLAARVGGQLDRLMRLVAELEAAEAAGQAGGPTLRLSEFDKGPRRSDVSSVGSVVGEETAVLPASDAAAALPPPLDAPGSRLPSKRLQWADGQAAPGAGAAGGLGCEAAQTGEDGGEDAEAAAAAAAAGERALRRGFQRRTWTGPAWLNTVSSSTPLTASLRKVAAGRGVRGGGGGRGGGRAAAAALKRIAGYTEEPGSDDEGANPFVLSSSEDEAEEEGVVDRQYLKHRAHKLTRAASKAEPASGFGSPTVRIAAR